MNKYAIVTLAVILTIVLFTAFELSTGPLHLMVTLIILAIWIANWVGHYLTYRRSHK